MKRSLFITALLAIGFQASADEGRLEISQASLPLVISSPGAYILTENLSGSSDAITVNSSHVTIDLNGFQLVGSFPTGGDGIQIGSVQNVIVRNGIIRGWGGHGINGSAGTGCVFQNLNFYGNFQNGLKAGSASRIQDITSHNNGVRGIEAGNGSFIKHCTVTGNGTDGIYVVNNCTVLECNVTDNDLYEIRIGSGNRIERNLCDCNGTGFNDKGIYIAGDNNLVEGNHVSNCKYGIEMQSIPTRYRNFVLGNTAANNEDDYYGLSGSNMIGFETDDVNNTNNVNAANAFMNLSK